MIQPNYTRIHWSHSRNYMYISNYTEHSDMIAYFDIRYIVQLIEREPLLESFPIGKKVT